ncbi:MAG: hypothetical protein PHT07_14385 [Paludibacter sp.]|nr:hypothetical protein [Paludibacter sp.]
MKQHRGLKRYYKKLSVQNDFDKIIWLNLADPNAWFDDLHFHFDYEGYGNNSFKRRKPHLDKLFRHFDLLTEMTMQIKKDFQLYSIILDYDSSSDALFLHTPNPNNSQFPFEINGLSKDTTLKNKQLDEYLVELKEFEKLYGQADEAFCLLYKKNIGIPFE